MAGSSSPAMASAVTRAGGVGSLGVARQSLNATRKDCQIMRTATNGAFNINFFAHKKPTRDNTKDQAFRKKITPYFNELDLGTVPDARVLFEPFNEDHLTFVLEAKPPVVSFHFGFPEKHLLDPIKKAGIYTLASATTVSEARELEAGGIDAIVAQGFEAGGNRGTFRSPYEDGLIGTIALIPQIVDAVTIPVIAAGGIADGRGIAAAIALGASAAQLGTAFLSCPESIIPDVHRDALAKAKDGQTRITYAFSGRPARGIENRYIREMAGNADELPEFPVLNTLTSPLSKGSAKANNPDFFPLWSGQAGAMHRVLPAGELLGKLVEETEIALQKFGTV
tara:strand:+ start:241 stop:1254 length:1014 start_codon:yes stop_codon:yes gene_type:complete